MCLQQQSLCFLQWYFISVISWHPFLWMLWLELWCKSSAVEIKLINGCWAARTRQFWKPVIYEIKVENRKWAYGRSCCHRSSPRLRELEHGLLNFHLWGRQDAAIACQKNYLRLRKMERTQGFYELFLNWMQLSQGKELDVVVVTACNTDPFIPAYTTPCALLTREAPMY